ncbi:MAG: trehalose 6-phosphate synthase [Actinomycetota bacterium]|jgi:trehalose 6-phosphate synthase
MQKRALSSRIGAGTATLVVVSNRGPVSFTQDDVSSLPVATRAGGGLASTLGGGVRGRDAVWVAVAMTDAERAASSALAAPNGEIDVEGYRLRLVDVDPDTFNAAYNEVANRTLWFWHHHMFDLVREPAPDAEFREAWTGYRMMNQMVALAAAEAAAPGATVLVHDYHLALVPALLRERRPDLRISHFSHTPWADPAFLHVLPQGVVGEILHGMAGADEIGFHSFRWADAFEACWRAHPSTRELPVPATYVAPAAADHTSVHDVMAGEQFAAEADWLDERVGDSLCIVRVDRMEPSKNLVRGFAAYAALLDAHPEWCERVTFVALSYPSRESLDAYRVYREEVEAAVARINARYGTPDWTPILLVTEDGFPRSIAALRRADVVLVNPIRDGLNLVAYEAQSAGARDSVLVLSRESGAWDELGQAGAIGINPFDVTEQADALHRALSMTGEEKASRSGRLRAAATARTPAMWLALQIEAVEDADVRIVDIRAHQHAVNQPIVVGGD